MNQFAYDNELVSVIMPCYNPTLHLVDSVKSVLMQTYSNLELLIIDDASAKPVQEMIIEFLTDERVRFIQQSENQGVAVTRNIGLNQSRGRYVAFLDCDDLWHPDKLEQQLYTMNTYQVPFVYSAYEVIRNNSDNVINIIRVPQWIDYQKLMKNTIIGCLTVLIDRKETGYFEMPILSVGEDTATWLNILKKGHVAYGIQIPLAKYRVTNISLSSNKWRMMKGTWKMYRKTQNLNIIKCFFCFSCYAFNAIKKRI